MPHLPIIDLAARFAAGYACSTPAAPGEAHPSSLEIAGAYRHGIFLHPPRWIDFEIPNADLHMRFHIAVSPHAWDRPGAGACAFHVEVDGRGRFSETIDPTNNPDDRVWRPCSLLIPRSSGAGAAAAAVRTLRLRTEGVPALDHRWALWGEPHAVVLDRLVREPGALRDDELAGAAEEAEVRRLRVAPHERINLGCGRFPLPGWCNIDGGDGRLYAPPEDEGVIKLDALRALRALDDGVAAYISSEHFFEHFTRQEGLAILREAWRVLRPGGVIRIQVPDLENVVRLYRNELPFAD